MTYSINQLKTLAQENPKELARVITSPNSDTHTVTFGAELLGEVSDETVSLPALKQLLKHRNAIVREGAMMGLSSFFIDKTPPRDVIDMVRNINKADPSPSNKEFAGTLLEEFTKSK